MDTLCGIGLPELIIVALIGFVVVGPERAREVAVVAGRWLGKAMRSPWWKEFNQVTSALRNLPTTLVRMAELEETQAELERTLRDIESETQVDFNEKQATKKTKAEASGEEKVEAEDPWGVGKRASDTEASMDLEIEAADEASAPSEESEPTPPEPSIPEPPAPEPPTDEELPTRPPDEPAESAGSEEQG
jgi:sec-independent protein translocase protein TatB